ncbi:MAG: threonine--tRNA ligase [Christensenellaceae bacterium]|jgi:threonyl-tRNA synthetase|nr:threonine--tRNA ligase [Christensenellaceae bacterium]
MINISLKDGSVIEVAKDSSILDIAKKISEGLARVAVAGEVNGKLVDLSYKLTEDARLNIITAKDDRAREIMRHTTSHVLANAIKRLYPSARLGAGPAIDGGFYYDFDLTTPIKIEDLPKIEAEMARIIKENAPIERKEVSRAEATRILNAGNETYKIEILAKIPRGEKISFYKMGEFMDLCVGPHLPSLDFIKAFKLTKITGAYFGNNAKNKMLTRIYGVCFDKKSELEEYLKEQEEIKQRDHNKIGRELGIFTTSDIVGQGLPLLMPNGAKLFQILSRFVEDECERRGYELTKTCSLAKKDLYEVSGHWDHYKDGMFVLGNELLDEEVFALRPMTCPFQFLIYKTEMHSYRDLPQKYYETSKLLRKESSGEMHGLTRVREFTLSDAHIIARPDQVKKIFKEVIDLITFCMKALKIDKNVWFRFSKWDPNNKEKYIDNPAGWESSQKQIREILIENEMEFVEADGEAAFYGPKIDIQTRNVHGKEDTIITMQLDFMLADNFDLTYIDENGKKVRPVIIHHSVIGSFERTIASLIEAYKGAFPLWLAPRQVVVMGITNAQDEYVEKITTELKKQGIRAISDLRNEKIGLKIREATLEKIPYQVIVGEKEHIANLITARTREGVDEGQMTLEQFALNVKTKCANFE